MEQMLIEFERIKLLIQDDTEGFLLLANKIQNFLENKEENLNEKLSLKSLDSTWAALNSKRTSQH
jgi:hypothetical protein